MDVEQAIARLPRWILFLTLAGVAPCYLHGGIPWIAGFLVGAVASYWNFRGIRRVVDTLARKAAEASDASVPRPRASGALFRVVLRFVLLGVGVFAILRVSEISVTAVLIGLFVSVAAVLLEILYELTFLYRV